MKKKKILIFIIVIATIINFKVLYNYRTENIKYENEIANDIYIDTAELATYIKHVNGVITSLLYGGNYSEDSLFFTNNYRRERFQDLNSYALKFSYKPNKIRDYQNIIDYIDNTTYCIYNIMNEDENH